MGQKVLFDGKIYTEPTAQSRIISGVRNVGSPSSFGNICIIDTGSGASYGGGLGVLDSVAATRQVDEFVNEFNNAAEMKSFVKGGVLWDLADYIYAPSNSAAGASKVFLIRAAQTAQSVSTEAGWTNTFTTVLNTKEEGLVANGTLLSTDLQSGYAWTVEAGVLDPAKFIFKFWLGQYRGTDSDGLLFDGIDAATAAASPKLITQSIEVASLEDLIAWSATDPDFQTFFEFDATSATTGNFAAADLVGFSGYNLFAGATETYSSTALDEALDNIKELDNSLFLSLDNGSDAAGTNNVKILAHINNEASFKKFLIIGGGDVSSDFAASKTNAGTLNSRYAVLCHGATEQPYSLNTSILQQKSSIYTAAMVTGRLSGLEPQTSITYKDLRIVKMKHTLTPSERVDAINSGVLHIRTVPQLGFVVNQGINTLQLNDFLINNDGTSPEISIERIEAQLNREIAANSAVLFIGGNKFSVTELDLVAFTRGYLDSKLAKTGVQDGLIVDYLNIKAERVGANFFITYDFEANTPINKIFSTGTIIDPTIV